MPFAYKAFVSYATQDHRDLRPGYSWAKMFAQKLQERLRTKGHKNAKVALDAVDGDRGEPSMRNLLGKLSDSAHLVILMGQNYKNSTYCANELQHYLGNERLFIDERYSISVVWLENFEPQRRDLPFPINQIRGYDFFCPMDGVDHLAIPDHPKLECQEVFESSLTRLAGDISKRLDRMEIRREKNASSEGGGILGTQLKSFFLCDVPDEAQNWRHLLANELMEAGHLIWPPPEWRYAKNTTVRASALRAGLPKPVTMVKMVTTGFDSVWAEEQKLARNSDWQIEKWLADPAALNTPGQDKAPAVTQTTGSNANFNDFKKRLLNVPLPSASSQATFPIELRDREILLVMEDETFNHPNYARVDELIGWLERDKVHFQQWKFADIAAQEPDPRSTAGVIIFYGCAENEKALDHWETITDAVKRACVFRSTEANFLYAVAKLGPPVELRRLLINKGHITYDPAAFQDLAAQAVKAVSKVVA